MQEIVTQIQLQGLRPGLWLAPFACDKHSRLAKEHPKWVLKAPGGGSNPANSANCGKWFLGLDVTNPEVQVHCCCYMAYMCISVYKY